MNLKNQIHDFHILDTQEGAQFVCSVCGADEVEYDQPYCYSCGADYIPINKVIYKLDKFEENQAMMFDNQNPE